MRDVVCPHIRVSKWGKGEWIKVICEDTNAYHVNPGLIFRTRKTGDLLVCDFCQCMYNQNERSWHLSAMKARNLSAISLKEVMNEIGIWSPKNEVGLSNMVEYVPSRDSRTKMQTKVEARCKQ